MQYILLEEGCTLLQDIHSGLAHTCLWVSYPDSKKQNQSLYTCAQKVISHIHLFIMVKHMQYLD
jgi:hypothetical protein